MVALHGTWEGLAATAQREAHQEWSHGMAAMHAALSELRAAARLAHGHYVDAATTNARHVAAGLSVVRIAVDATATAAPPRRCAAATSMAALHYGTLTQKLVGFAGMAGDDYTSEEFAQQYDVAAQEAVDGLDDVVDAFATLCGLVGQSHVNHRRADAAAVYGHPAPTRRGSTSSPAPSTSARCG